MKVLLFGVVLLVALGCASARSALVDGTAAFEYHTERYIERCQKVTGFPPGDCVVYYLEVDALQKELLELVSAMELGSQAPLQRKAVKKRVRAINKEYARTNR